MEKAVYKHDCERCIFIRRLVDRTGVTSDLYLHQYPDHITAIKRDSDEPSDNSSYDLTMLPATLWPEWVWDAVKRAMDLKILKMHLF